MNRVCASAPQLADIVPYDPKYLPADIYMSANENPSDVEEDIRRRIEKAVRKVPFNRYPDPLANSLRDVIAPEHLELHVRDAMELLGSIRNAGAIFLGEWTPEAVGDYIAGPNHTLPTGGTARFASPLSVDEFIKKSSIIQYSPRALANDSRSVMQIAMHEGLWAHAQSVALRMRALEDVEASTPTKADGDQESK